MNSRKLIESKKGEKMNITQEDMKILLKSQQGELDVVLMYRALADAVKDANDQEAFRKLAAEEGHHAAVFHNLTKENLKPKKTKAIFVPLLYKIIGRKKLYKIIANGEYHAADIYRPVCDKFPEIESVMNDEKRHGDIVSSLIKN